MWGRRPNAPSGHQFSAFCTVMQHVHRAYQFSAFCTMMQNVAFMAPSLPLMTSSSFIGVVPNERLSEPV